MFPFPIGGGGERKKLRAGIMTIVFFVLLAAFLTNILVKVFSAVSETAQTAYQTMGQYFSDEAVNKTVAEITNTSGALFIHVDQAVRSAIALSSFIKALLTDPVSLLLLMGMSLILYFLVTGESE